MQAEYLGVQFALSEKSIRTLSSVGIKREMKYSETKARGGLPTLDITGYEPQSLTIDYKAIAGAGVDPLKEYNGWKKKLGESGLFYLAGQQFGVDEFVLMGVKLRNTILTAAGKVESGTIELQLDQDVIKTEKKEG